MRLLFAGSPAIAVPSLRALAAAGHEIVGLLTNPDAQAGRGRRESPTELALAAAGLVPDAPVLKPERLGPEAREAVAELRPDLMAVAAYGRVFGPKFLALFPRGAINMHPSLLPRWRGATPMVAAILNRDAETGVSVQRVALELDSGDILAQEAFPLEGRETAAGLAEKCGEIGARLMVRVVAEIAAGRETAVPQDPAKATWCGTVAKDAGLVDWARGAADIDAMVRAYSPWPGAHSYLGDQRLNILEAEPLAAEAPGMPRVGGDGGHPGLVVGIDRSRGILVQTGEGLLAIARLQLEAKKAMGFRDFANGVRGLAGSTLGQRP